MISFHLVLQEPDNNLPFGAKTGIRNGSGLPRSEITVTIPNEEFERQLIHLTAEMVVKHGPQFEMCLMIRELENPAFDFLKNEKSQAHVYYRWKLYSLFNGDSIKKWRLEPFQMFHNAAWWIPPKPIYTEQVLMLM